MEAGRQLEPGFCINKELFFKPFENITKIKSFCMFFIRLFRFREHICPINLHSEKLFQFTQIFIGCHLRFFRVASTQIFFRVAAWKKLGVILINQKKNQGSALKKIWVDATLRNLRWHPMKICVDFTGYPSNHFWGCRLNGWSSKVTGYYEWEWCIILQKCKD